MKSQLLLLLFLALAVCLKPSRTFSRAGSFIFEKSKERDQGFSRIDEYLRKNYEQIADAELLGVRTYTKAKLRQFDISYLTKGGDVVMMMVTYDDDKKQMQVQNNKRIHSKNYRTSLGNTVTQGLSQPLSATINLSQQSSSAAAKPIDLTVSIVPNTQTTVKEPLVGGYRLLTNYMENEHFAKVDQLIRSRYAQLASAQVFKVETQVVSGFNFRVTYKTVQSIFYQAVVWVVPWENKFEIMSFNKVDSVDEAGLMSQQPTNTITTRKEEKLLSGVTQFVGTSRQVQTSSTVAGQGATQAPLESTASPTSAVLSAVQLTSYETASQISNTGGTGAVTAVIETQKSGISNNQQIQQVRQTQKTQQSNSAIVSTLSQLSSQLDSQKPPVSTQPTIDTQIQQNQQQIVTSYTLHPVPTPVQQAPAEVQSINSVLGAQSTVQSGANSGAQTVETWKISQPQPNIQTGQIIATEQTSSIKSEATTTRQQEQANRVQYQAFTNLAGQSNAWQNVKQRTKSEQKPEEQRATATSQVIRIAAPTAIQQSQASITSQPQVSLTQSTTPQQIQTNQNTNSAMSTQQNTQQTQQIHQTAQQIQQIQQTLQHSQTSQIQMSEPLMVTAVPASSSITTSKSIFQAVAPKIVTLNSVSLPTPVAPPVDPAPVVQMYTNEDKIGNSQSTSTMAALSNLRSTQTFDAKSQLSAELPSNTMAVTHMSSGFNGGQQITQQQSTNNQAILNQQKSDTQSASGSSMVQVGGIQDFLSNNHQNKQTSTSTKSSSQSQTSLTQTFQMSNSAAGQSNSVAFYSNNPYFLACDQMARSQYPYELSKSQIVLVIVRKVATYYYFLITYDTWQGRYEAKINVKGNNYSLVMFKKILQIDQKNPLCRHWEGTKCKECVFRAYFDPLGQCQEVSRLCKTFDTVAGFCKSCYPGYQLEDGACYLTIQHARNENCRTVDKAGVCTSCYFRYYLDDNNQCRQVSDQCKTWDEKGRCTTCYGGYDLSKGQCLVARS